MVDKMARTNTANLIGLEMARVIRQNQSGRNNYHFSAMIVVTSISWP